MVLIKLPVRYVCRKCSKNYSQQDFNENRFCRDCGSLILKEFTVAYFPVTSDKLRRRQHFLNSGAEVEKLKENPQLKHVAERFKQRSEAVKEYEVIPEFGSKLKPFGVSEDWIFKSEYDMALKLKKKLIREFKGRNIGEVLPGKIVTNEHGECWCIFGEHDVGFEKNNYNASRQLLLSDLKLISGIGPMREQMLKKQGYITIDALEKHPKPKWQSSAKEFTQLLEAKDVLGLQDWLRRSLPKSHPLSYCLAGLCRDEDFTVIDIETMGLFGRAIILLGIAKVVKRKVCTSQFLLRTVSDEASALYAFMTQFKTDSALISFNGRCFDVPFIRERLSYYGLSSNLEASLEIPHFDVLHFARRALHGKLGDCRLETVEKYLGLHRSINIPGALVPEFYDTYQRSGNVGPLVAIVEHNKQDLITLAQLFCRLLHGYRFRLGASEGFYGHKPEAFRCGNRDVSGRKRLGLRYAQFPEGSAV